MKKLLFISLLLPCFSFGQNMVPNGDFELGPDSTSIAWADGMDSVCIISGIVLGPDFWIPTSGSPDRLVEGNLCGFDNDTAQSGNAYINIGTFTVGNPESGKTTLSSPLQQDSLYRLTYYFDLQGGCPSDSAKLAFKFNNGGDSILSPVITTHGWQMFDTLFTALSNSTEMEISGVGNAFSCANIDNITLEKITQTSSKEIHKEYTRIILYPNPTTGKFTVQGASGEIQVFDLYGRLVLRTNKPEIDMSSYPAGLYIWQVGTQRGKLVLE